MKELNVDNVVEFLNSKKNDYKQIKDYIKNAEVIGISMINHFNDTFTNNIISFDNTPYHNYISFIRLTESYRNKIIKTVNVIKFKTMFPNIIYNLYKEGEITFSINEYGKIYCFMVKYKDDILNHINTSPTTQQILNLLLNTLYSASIYNSKLLIDNINKVTLYYYSVFNNIYDTKKNNIMYIDTDEIYFIGDENKFIEQINKLNIPYEIERGLNIWFYNLKKYIYEYNGEIVKRGLSVSARTKRNVEDIISQFKNMIRLKKINKLINNEG